MAGNNITYSFLDCQASIDGPGGSFACGNGSGIAEEGISIEPTTEIATMVIGADGTGQHNLMADRSGKVTFNVLKTSPLNALMMQLYEFQTSAGYLYGQNTIVVSDSARGDVITMAQAGFAKAPTIKYGKVGEMQVWEFKAVNITRVLGGSGGVGGVVTAGVLGALA